MSDGIIASILGSVVAVRGSVRALRADDKENAGLIASQINLDVLNEPRMGYPEVHQPCRKELQSVRKPLADEGE